MTKGLKTGLIITGTVLLVGGVLFAFRKQIFKSADDNKPEENNNPESGNKSEKETEKEVKKEVDKIAKKTTTPPPSSTKKARPSILLKKIGKRVDAKKFMDALYTYMKGFSTPDETAKATSYIRILNDLSNKDFVTAWKAFGVRNGDNVYEYYITESAANPFVARDLWNRYVDLKPLLV